MAKFAPFVILISGTLFAPTLHATPSDDPILNPENTDKKVFALMLGKYDPNKMLAKSLANGSREAALGQIKVADVRNTDGFAKKLLLPVSDGQRPTVTGEKVVRSATLNVGSDGSSQRLTCSQTKGAIEWNCE